MHFNEALECARSYKAAFDELRETHESLIELLCITEEKLATLQNNCVDKGSLEKARSESEHLRMSYADVVATTKIQEARVSELEFALSCIEKSAAAINIENSAIKEELHQRVLSHEKDLHRFRSDALSTEQALRAHTAGLTARIAELENDLNEKVEIAQILLAREEEVHSLKAELTEWKARGTIADENDSRFISSVQESLNNGVIIPGCAPYDRNAELKYSVALRKLTLPTDIDTLKNYRTQIAEIEHIRQENSRLISSRIKLREKYERLKLKQKDTNEKLKLKLMKLVGDNNSPHMMHNILKLKTHE
jgi:hypothetical protein